MKESEILERLKIVASTLSDFAKYYDKVINLQEQLDESIEYYDFEEWLTGDDNYFEVMDCFSIIDNYFVKKLDTISNTFFAALNLLHDLDTKAFIEEFGSEIEKEDLNVIREYIEDNNMFLDMEHDYTIEENYNNVKNVILSAYEVTQSKKQKDIQRPFFNDNFIMLKILNDKQVTIDGVKSIQLSLRDLTKITGFSLNKVQSIMSSLIRWGYIKHDSNKYILTDDGKAILNAMLKVPTTKIV